MRHLLVLGADLLCTLESLAYLYELCLAAYKRGEETHLKEAHLQLFSHVSSKTTEFSQKGSVVTSSSQ